MLARLRRNIHSEPPAWLLVTAIIFFIVIISGSITYWVFTSNYKDRVFPGVFVGEVNLSGLTQDEALAKLGSVVNEYNQNGIIISFKDSRVALKANQSDGSDENASSLIDFDLDKTTAKAYSYGREADLLTNFTSQIKALLGKEVITPNYAISEKGVTTFLNNNFANKLKLANNAKLLFNGVSFSIVPEKSGYQFAFTKALGQIEELVSSMRQGVISLEAKELKPQITSETLSPLLAEANNQINRGALKLSYKQNVFSVKPENLGFWLTATSTIDGNALDIDQDKILNYLNLNIAPKIEIKVIDARFIMKNGKASAFASARDGLAINATATLANIKQDWLENQLSSTSIIMTAVKSQSASSTDAVSLGITELIGVGTSNFAGSPANRRHNISIGMSYLNGLLIPPGETFSVMKHLGTIDASKGYLEELVIKKDKTEKEFGGGLCQVGTTMFRAALSAGLPITERRNHSYRVAYYEPAGTDATIYDPSPDLKFKNDTGSYVLIQGYMSGNKLTFEMWGTKDGRITTQTYPKIFNIVKPPAGKIIETLTLKPGQKKCTEKAHNGADASFSYKVVYPNSEIKTKQFNSHYVPWQEVCLIGVSKLSTTTSSSNSSTSTAAIIPASSSTSKISNPSTSTSKTASTTVKK